jgi:hypothetical protein
MTVFARLKNPAFVQFIREQHLRELFIRKEFRVSEEYVRREFLPCMEDDEVRNLSLSFRAGFAVLSGEVKKRLLPAISFSARFSVEKVSFNSWEKKIFLRMEEVRPVDFDWLTRRMAERLPFLTYGEGLLVCDLTRVPRLGEMLAYRVRGVRVSDFLTIRELALREGEVAGRLGVVL